MDNESQVITQMKEESAARTDILDSIEDIFIDHPEELVLEILREVVARYESES